MLHQVHARRPDFALNFDQSTFFGVGSYLDFEIHSIVWLYKGEQGIRNLCYWGGIELGWAVRVVIAWVFFAVALRSDGRNQIKCSSFG